MAAAHSANESDSIEKAPATSKMQAFLRKARGQIDRPANIESKSTYVSKETAIGSASESDQSLSHEHGSGDVFANGGDSRYYEPIASYEGRHRWDPHAEWTEQEEKKLVRKIDWRICLWACVMFFALQLDRSNISQALSDNMLDDLGMTTNQYNYGQTIFYLCFLFAELPSQLISKKLGPDNWIPVQMVLWSIIASSQSHIHGKSSFYATRALLGLIEGGFIPDVILYLSYFYTSKELPIRLGFFWAAFQFTSIIAAFLAFGILHLRGHNGWAGWRWLFALEGALTALIGIISFFYLPPSPTETASRFRGKDGWFNEREEIIMVNRVLRDDPGKGDMHNRQGLSFALIRDALLDYDMWPVYLIGLTWGIPQQTVSSYLTLTLKSLGWGTFEVNLLSIPAYALFIIQLLIWTWISERINNRFLMVFLCQVYMLPLVIALEVIPANENPWVKYALSILMVGFPYIHPILVAITSRNAGSVRTRTIGSALYNMTVQASNIISSNIYRTSDKPMYRTGNKVLIGIIAWSMAVIAATKVYYMWRNSTRDKIWNAMSQEEKDDYLANTKDEGNKRLDFRFAH